MCIRDSTYYDPATGRYGALGHGISDETSGVLMPLRDGSCLLYTSGNVGTGSVISPYYDSLLVKVTSWDRTFEAVCRKARRAINEEHVRGVKTNISFVTNILNHPTFINGKCHTKFCLLYTSRCV